LEIFVNFIIYFIGGYVLYASIFAVIGSSVDNEQDTQQFMTPITLLLLFAFYAGFYSVNNPDGPVSLLVLIYPFHFTYRNEVGTHSVRHTVMAESACHRHFVWLFPTYFDVGCKNLSCRHPDVW